MADNEPKPYKFAYEDGFYAALRVWAVFILLFALFGVPPVLSILLGAIAAVATRQIVALWKAEEDPNPPATPEPPVFKPVNNLLGRLRQLPSSPSTSRRRRGPRRL